MASIPTLLAIPLEIRLQIFRYLLRADDARICPHARLPYLFIRSEIGNQPNAPNDIFVPALLINRQLYFEMKPILYTENIFYFESCLTGSHRDPPSFPQKLLTSIGKNVRRIGFTLDLIESGSKTKEESTKAAERVKAEFGFLSTHLPNLSSTRIDLFCAYARPCQSFLVSLLRSCQLLLPGIKIMTVHSTNREKARIANILRTHLDARSDLFLLLGGCMCIPFLQRSPQQLDRLQRWSRYNLYSREKDRAQPDKLTHWVWEMSHCPRGRNSGYRFVAKHGSMYLSDQVKFKGPLIGCLLCKLSTHCVHEARYSPMRKVPMGK